MATVLEPSIDRGFGLVFMAVFALYGCWPLLHVERPRWWALAVAAAFALAALAWPSVLHPLNRAWLALGRLLHRVVSPIVLGAIFFLCVTPIAWIMRRRGKDVLSLARRPDLSTYWIARGPAEPSTETMKRQF